MTGTSPITTVRSDSLVIIPTYNEKENVAAIIAAVLDLPVAFDILIIDDNSPDGTADIVKGLIAKHPQRLHIVERKGKLGLGTAYIAGFKWALEHGYEYICEMDADFSHYLTGVNVVNWPMGRVLMSYYASVYVRTVTRMPVHDATAGFVCYRRRVLEALPLDKIRFKGYAFQIEMKFLAYKYGFGTSKMSSGIFSEGFFGVMRLKWSSLFTKYPDYSTKQ